MKQLEHLFHPKRWKYKRKTFHYKTNISNEKISDVFYFVKFLYLTYSNLRYTLYNVNTE